MVSLLNFTNGKSSEYYSSPSEIGFNVQGNIGAILNDTSCENITSIQGGICVNQKNKTKDPGTILNNIHLSNRHNEYEPYYTEQDTEIITNGIEQSQLLPHYTNGIPNMILGPSPNLTLNGVGYPSLYGETTAFINNPNLINNPNNNIGHQVSSMGLANINGSRGLG